MSCIEIHKQIQKLKTNPNHRFIGTIIDNYLNSVAQFARYTYLQTQEKTNYWYEIKLSDFDFIRWQRLVQNTAIDALRDLRNNPNLKDYKNYSVLDLKKTGKNDPFEFKENWFNANQ